MVMCPFHPIGLCLTGYNLMVTRQVASAFQTAVFIIHAIKLSRIDLLCILRTRIHAIRSKAYL